MAKTVFKGRGALISGTCPRCPEMVSVFLREDESYRNSRCTYCGADIYGDGISGIIREGHHVSLIPQKGVKDASMHENAACPPEILEYDKKQQEERQDTGRQHSIFEIPHRILKRTKREMNG